MPLTAWELGGSRRAARFRKWAHMLGYGGHFLTNPAVTRSPFGQLRAARAEHRRTQRPPGSEPDAWGRPLDETVVLVVHKIWTYAGIGRRPVTPGAELALASADRARGH